MAMAETFYATKVKIKDWTPILYKPTKIHPSFSYKPRLTPISEPIEVPMKIIYEKKELPKKTLKIYQPGEYQIGFDETLIEGNMLCTIDDKIECKPTKPENIWNQVEEVPWRPEEAFEALKETAKEWGMELYENEKIVFNEWIKGRLK